jgi:hypothetical protein
MKKYKEKQLILIVTSAILWLFSSLADARSSYNLQTHVLFIPLVSINEMNYEVNLIFDNNRKLTLIDAKLATQTSDRPVIYDNTTGVATIPYIEVAEISKAYSASLTLVSVDPVVTFDLTSLEEIALLPPPEATTALISGKISDIPNTLAFEQLQISSFYDSTGVNNDGSYSVVISKLGNTLVTLEANNAPIMLGVMSPESSMADYKINAESTAKALLFFTGIFNSSDASSYQKAEELLNSNASYTELVDYIRLGLQNQTWRLDETNLQLREKVYAVLREVIAAKQKTAGNSRTLSQDILKKEIEDRDDDIDFPQPSREINSLKIVDPFRNQDDFLFWVQNRGKRWVSAIVKKGHLDAEGRFIFKQTGDLHLIPSPSVSLLDYANFIFNGKETPAIVWPLKKEGINPFKESLKIVDNNVSTADAIKIVLLGIGSENKVQLDGEEEMNTLLASYIFTGIFDILRPALEMTLGFNNISPYSKPKLMSPKEAKAPFLKEVTKRFYIKQGLSEKNWLLQYQQGKTSAIMSDIIDSIRKTFIEEPGLAVSFLLPYLPENVQLNALNFSATIKKAGIHLKLLDMGGKAYNLLHTAIDIGTLSVRTEFRYKRYNDSTNEPESALKISHVDVTGLGCGKSNWKFCVEEATGVKGGVWPVLLNITVTKETAAKIDAGILRRDGTGLTITLPNRLERHDYSYIHELGRSNNGLTFHALACVRDPVDPIKVDLSLGSGGDESNIKTVTVYSGCSTTLCDTYNGEEYCFDYNCIHSYCNNSSSIGLSEYNLLYEDGNAWYRKLICTEEYQLEHPNYCASVSD